MPISNDERGKRGRKRGKATAHLYDIEEEEIRKDITSFALALCRSLQWPVQFAALNANDVVPHHIPEIAVSHFSTRPT